MYGRLRVMRLEPVQLGDSWWDWFWTGYLFRSVLKIQEDLHQFYKDISTPDEVEGWNFRQTLPPATKQQARSRRSLSTEFAFFPFLYLLLPLLSSGSWERRVCDCKLQFPQIAFPNRFHNEARARSVGGGGWATRLLPPRYAPTIHFRQNANSPRLTQMLWSGSTRSVSTRGSHALGINILSLTFL